MIFHSLEYAVFFAVVLAIYLALPHKGQNRFLLVASYFFYGAWDWRFLSLIALTTITDFLCARAIHRSKEKSTQKKFVAISCVVNLGVLGFFKYFDFFLENFAQLLSSFGVESVPPVLGILLPVGISFYTFQSLSYTIDVYRKQVEPAQNIFDYGLYVSFFPQLVAGPIERGKNLLPQVLKPRTFDKDRVYQGLFLIYLGIFKKLFLADNLAKFVDPVFAKGADPSGAEVLIAGYAFLFQVYCDFSAYTDIARGSAKLLGFELMENFRAPYLARNLQEFWNRWHISLTTWIRDYLYYPLAFTRIRRKSIPVWLVTIITFSIMGLWHGAAWGFVLWGVYNGIALASYAALAKPLARMLGPSMKTWAGKNILPVIFVMTTFHVILIGDIFFRSSSLSQSVTLVATLFSDFSLSADFFRALLMISYYILPMVLIDLIARRKPIEEYFVSAPALVRYAVMYLFLVGIVKFGVANPTFIYFQF